MSLRGIGVLFFLGGFVVMSSCLRMESTDRTVPNKVEDSVQVVDYTIEEHAAQSLLGNELYAPPLNQRTKSRREEALSAALESFNAEPDSLDNIIWFGRRLAYLSFYKEAIQVYTDGLELYPVSYELYRHRGHRFLTIRHLDEALVDLEKSAFYVRDYPIRMEKTEVSGRIPRASIQFNIWYHLGLTYYLKGNYDKAVSAYRKCLEYANNDDMQVAVIHWLYMTYRRLGSVEPANELLELVVERMNVVENKAYHKLLLMYKGELSVSGLVDLNRGVFRTVDQLTYGYGIGNWYFYHGETEKAFHIFNQMMKSPNWPAFGYLAAEVELSNQRVEERH